MTYFDAPYRPADLTLNSDAINSSLVGFWPLTDGSGTSAVDVSTGGNNGTIVNGTYQVGDGGTELYLSGSSSAVDLGDLSLNTSTAFTVTAWIDGTYGSNNQIVCRDEYSVSRHWQFRTDTSSRLNLIRFNSGGGVVANFSGSTSLTDGERYFVAFTFDTINGSVIYLNGNVDGTNSSTNANNSGTGTEILIGAFQQNGFTTCMPAGFQNVRIFDAALTAAQVEQLYTRPWTGTNYDTEALWLSPPASPTLSTASQATSIMADIEGWWVMTDGSGTTLTDISGNGRDATLNGTNTWETETLGTVNRFDNSSSSGNNARTADTQPDLSSGYTVAFWIKHEELLAGTNSYGGGFALTDGAGTGTWWHTISSDIEIYFNSFFANSQHPQVVHNRANGGIHSSYNRNDGTKANQNNVWHFWVVTFDGTNARAYQDASLVGTSGTLTAPLSTTGKHIVINGPADAANGLTCSMQNVRLYSRCLSADEITTLYERPWIGAEYNESFYLYPPVPSSLTPLDSSSINTDQELWLPLTDGTGTTAVDISGGGNDGTLDAALTHVNTAKGAAVSFPANGGIDSSATISSQPITVSAWFYLTTLPTIHGTSLKTIFTGQGSSSTPTIYCYNPTGSKPIMRMYSGSAYLEGVTQINANEWTNVAGVFDGTSSELYVNGVLEASGNVGTSGLSSGFRLGEFWNSIYDFPGYMQNVRLWSRALSSTEVADIFYSPWLGSAYTGTSSDPATNRYFSPAAFARLG